MGLEISAIYENGTLKLERELALEKGQRVILTIHPVSGRVKRSYGLIGSKLGAEELQRAAEDPEFGIVEGP